MSPFDDSQRIDSRSQWLSSTLADLDRQQDPASAPPVGVSGQSATMDDPLGSATDGRKAPAHQDHDDDAPTQRDDVAATPQSSAPSLLQAGGLDLQSQAPQTLTAGATPSDGMLNHVGAGAAQPSMTPDQPIATPAEPQSATDTLAPAAPAAVTPVTPTSVVTSQDMASPGASAQNGLAAFEDRFDADTALGSLLDRFDVRAREDDDNPLEISILTQASDQLAEVAAELFGPRADGEGDSDGSTALFDDLADDISTRLDGLVGTLTTDAFSLTKLLNHDLDLDHPLG